MNINVIKMTTWTIRIQLLYTHGRMYLYVKLFAKTQQLYFKGLNHENKENIIFESQNFRMYRSVYNCRTDK
jgi:hypothetical protein